MQQNITSQSLEAFLVQGNSVCCEEDWGDFWKDGEEQVVYKVSYTDVFVETTQVILTPELLLSRYYHKS